MAGVNYDKDKDKDNNKDVSGGLNQIGRKASSSVQIYLSGPITGVTGYAMLFDQVKNNLTEALYERSFWTKVRIVNPADFPSPVVGRSPEWSDWMRLCIIHMMPCSAVLAVGEWERSAGARLECQLALNLGIPVYNEMGPLLRDIANFPFEELAAGGLIRPLRAAPL